MSTGTAVLGPAWSSLAPAPRTGRDHLGLNGPVTSQVRAMAGGVGYGTAHAAYYTLHALVAAETAAKGLTAEQQQDLVRRCEVVLGAISTDHQNPHPGLNRASGVGAIGTALASGTLDIPRLSAPGGYLKPSWGTWDAYLTAEETLGLIEVRKGLRLPGETLPEGEIRSGLDGLLSLASQDRIDVDTLRGHRHLCLCELMNRADGQALLRVFLGKDAEVDSAGHRNGQTARTILRSLAGSAGISSVDEAAAEAHRSLLQASEASPPEMQWQGISLRNTWTESLSRLWVDAMETADAPTPLEAVCERFALSWPAEATVSEWVSSVAPAATDLPGLAGALASLTESSKPPAHRDLAVVCTIASHLSTLPDGVRDALNSGPSKSFDRSTPSWFTPRLAESLTAPIRTFVSGLIWELTHRSQQVAMRRAELDWSTGQMDIPLGIQLNDGLVEKTGPIGVSGVWLRWSALIRIMAGLGLVRYGTDGWQLTDAGRQEMNS